MFGWSSRQDSRNGETTHQRHSWHSNWNHCSWRLLWQKVFLRYSDQRTLHRRWQHLRLCQVCKFLNLEGNKILISSVVQQRQWNRRRRLARMLWTCTSRSEKLQLVSFSLKGSCYDRRQHSSFSWRIREKNWLESRTAETGRNGSQGKPFLSWRKKYSDPVQVYGVQVYDEDAATPFYKALANATGGEYIPLKDFHHITEVFTGLCYVEASDRQFDAHKETISNFRPETGSAHIFFTEEMDELQFTDEDLLRIHSAIHSGATEVQFQGEQHPISTGKSGCRRVIIKGERPSNLNTWFAEIHKQESHSLSRTRPRRTPIMQRWQVKESKSLGSSKTATGGASSMARLQARMIRRNCTDAGTE